MKRAVKAKFVRICCVETAKEEKGISVWYPFTTASCLSISKAFDRVWQVGLIYEKLKRCGVFMSIRKHLNWTFENCAVEGCGF